jgi:trk system potassium uptake protein TrkA
VHVVIMGCGRVGSTLAHSLDDLDHTVAVIDRDARAFRRLGPHFTGQQVTGVGFDRDTMIEAGIERAHAFAAVSSGDNSNIISARVARETFGVENVVARIYDPKRAAVYTRLGIPTVATVRWTADAMLRRLLPEGSEIEWRDSSGRVAFAEVALSTEWVGEPLHRLEDAAGVRVAFLTRNGEGMVPVSSTLVQDGDLVHVAAPVDRLADVERIFAAAPPPEQQ